MCWYEGHVKLKANRKATSQYHLETTVWPSPKEM
jgi:hypothetical protein